MAYRLNVANLRAAAAEQGDTTDYKIVKRSGVPKATAYRLIAQQAEPSVSVLLRFAGTYGLTAEQLIEEAPALAEAS